MKNNRVVFILVAVLLIFMSAGCGANNGASSQNQTTNAPTSNSSSSAPAAAEQSSSASDNNQADAETPDTENGDYVFSVPFVTEPTSVSWAMGENPDPSYPNADHLVCYQVLEEITGVHITIESPAEYNVAMQTRLAAGIDLPDVMAIPGGAADQTKYVNAGLFLELTDLIHTYAPHLTAWYNERPDLWGYLTAPDGNVYSIACSVEARSMLNYTCPGIRYDWIDKLGMEVPTTIPELYDVLMAFKNEDPNGNGEADEIPIIGKYDTVPNSLAWSYGLHFTHSGGWYYDSDGKVVYEWISDAARDWVTEMAKWYKDGLFDPDFTAPQSDKYNAQAMGDIAGMAQQMSMMYPQWNDRMRGDFPDANWKAIMPVSADGHGNPIMEREFPYSTYFAITKDCKDPELNMKLIDWMMASPEGSVLFNYGREGIEFDYVNGDPILSKENVLEYERGSGLALQMLGAIGSGPLILAKGSVEQRFLIFPDECAMSALSESYKVPRFPMIIATDQEAEIFTRIMADINTYREESILKFMMGETPLSEWDAFVATIEGMNIQEAINVRQTQLDRYNASIR